MVSPVVLGTLFTAALTGLGWSLSAHWLAQRHAEENSRLLLELSAAELRQSFQSAQFEVQSIALDEELRRAAAAWARAPHPGESESRAIGRALRTWLPASERFDAAVVLDLAGARVTPIGTGAPIRDLVGALEPRSALDVELAVVMRGAELRKELSGIESPLLWALDVGGTSALILASVPIHDPRGDRVATLHGHVRSESVSQALRRAAAVSGEELSLVSGDAVVLGSSLGEGESAAPNGGSDLVARHLAFLAPIWSQRRSLPLEMHGWQVVMDESGIRNLVPIVLAVAASVVLALVLAPILGGYAFVRATRLARPLWALGEALRRAGDGEEIELPTPHVSGEVEVLCRNFNVSMRKLADRRNELERENRALRDQNDNFQTQHENLSKLTVTDALTHLPNRRFFEDQLGKEIKRLGRHAHGLSMLVLDIDDFKKLNDQFGHAAGDEFLRQVARILTENVRATDLVARFGGEEFVIIAIGTPLDGAVVLAEKVRTAVAEASFIVDATMRPRRATISVGVAVYRGSQTDLFNSADAALYEAKAAGKNCVVVASTDRPESAR